MAKKVTTDKRQNTDNRRSDELDGSRGHRPRGSQILPTRDKPKNPPTREKRGWRSKGKKEVR